ELQTKLQLTRLVQRRCHPAAVRVGQIGVRTPEDNVVKEVEGFGAKLKGPLFAKSNVELPEYGQVDIPPPIRAQRVGLGVAVRVGRGIRVGRRIEPGCYRVAAGIGIAHKIGSLVVAATIIQARVTGGYR